MSNNPDPFGSPNPYGGQNPYGAQNPYSSPSFTGPPGGRPPLGAKLMAPAIVLLVLSILGVGVSMFNVVFAFREPVINPNDPPLVQEMQKGAVGPAAAIVQSICVLMNGFIVFGAVQMMRQKMRGVAIAASVVAMLNFGSCCCILGIPIGIWSVIILMQEDVKAAFEASAYS